MAQQADAKKLEQGYYAVVGAFKIHDNAKRFTEELSKKGMNVSYGVNGESGIYYVTTGSYSTPGPAIQEVKLIRSDTAFQDAWVKLIGPTKSSPDTVTITRVTEPEVIIASAPVEDSVVLETERLR